MTINTRKSLKYVLSLLIVTYLVGCTPLTVIEINDNTFYQLQQDVESIKNSQVADAAPMEMKIISEKLQRTKQAKANGDLREEARLTQQIRADMTIARLRAKVNGLNQSLLEKRDELSAARVYLQQLEAQLP
ncbi:MAG: DUF4398 domain-containing protein [Proteobacteria bacterium]|nr:MAG: DUF4398 domain-containing protein [Pseudomonadota bacterium]